jgi:hypothetical protein
MSALAQKITRRLIEMGELDGTDLNVEASWIDRHRPGHWQRSAGAWSWSLILVRNDGGICHDSFGSQWSATECAKAKNWDFYTTGIDKGIIPLKEES